MVSHNNNDLLNLYNFAKSNSNVEWDFNTYKNKFVSFSTLNTCHDDKYVEPVSYTFLKIITNVSLIYSCHNHPGVYNPNTRYPAHPSGFDYDFQPDNKQKDGDRQNYEFMNQQFPGRIPEYFDLDVPNKPSIHVLYNDKVAIPSGL